MDPQGKGFSNIPVLWDDKQIGSHSKLTERVHKHGAKIVAQIYHAGRQTNHLLIIGDALETRKALEAIEEGYKAGVSI